MTTTADPGRDLVGHRILRPGRATAAVGVVTVAVVVVPFVLLGPGPDWQHLVFHVVGLLLCTLGVLALRSLRRATSSRATRGLTWAASAALAGWAVGHLGELVVVLTHGAAAADEDVFDDPVHAFFASIAIPAWMASVLLCLAVVVAALVTRRSWRRAE